MRPIRRYASFSTVLDTTTVLRVGADANARSTPAGIVTSGELNAAGAGTSGEFENASPSGVSIWLVSSLDGVACEEES